MQEANLNCWYAFIYSMRFWQYFFLDLFGGFLGLTFYRDFGRAGEGAESDLIKFGSSIIIGYSYAHLGFRTVFIILILINIVIGVSAIIVNNKTTDDDHYEFDKRNNTSLLILYRIMEVVDSGKTVLIASSSPRTFGIRYGSLVMCFIFLGDIISSIVIL